MIIHFHLLSSDFIHFHSFSSTSSIFTHFHPLASIFIHFHPFSSTSSFSPTFIHFHPLFIHFHPLLSIFILFHPLLSTFIHQVLCKWLSSGRQVVTVGQGMLFRYRIIWNTHTYNWTGWIDGMVISNTTSAKSTLRC